MIANDDPAPYLREHGWELEPHGCAWRLARADGVFCLIDMEADAPRSLFEPRLAGTVDIGMNPAAAPRPCRPGSPALGDALSYAAAGEGRARQVRGNRGPGLRSVDSRE